MVMPKSYDDIHYYDVSTGFPRRSFLGVFDLATMMIAYRNGFIFNPCFIAMCCCVAVYRIKSNVEKVGCEDWPRFRKRCPKETGNELYTGNRSTPTP